MGLGTVGESGFYESIPQSNVRRRGERAVNLSKVASR